MQINKKTFIVTGAGGGIGGELALNLLNQGAKVIALDLRKEFLKTLNERADKKAKNLSTYSIDITDQTAVLKLSQKIIKIHKIDGLINSAGIIQPFIKINDLTLESAQKVMDVNFYGTFNTIKAFLPHLTKRPEACIANISSMGGFLPVPGQSVYGASKAAVKLMTEGLYAELSGSNVHVSVIFPGAIKTNISQNSGIDMKLDNETKAPKIKMLEASKAAKVIIDGIKKNKYQILVGQDAKMMDFLYRLSPKFANNLISKQMRSLLK